MLQHKGTVELFASGLRLRRFTMDDAPAMFHTWASDDRVTKYVTFRTHTSLETTRSVLAWCVPEYEKKDYYYWLIEWEGAPAGSFMLFNVDEWNARAEVGYCLGYAYWNKGIATKALRLVLDFAFGEVGFEKIFGQHDMENPASGRVMEKAGMVREAVLRRHFRRRDGIFSDLAVYGICRKDWEAERKGSA